MNKMLLGAICWAVIFKHFSAAKVFPVYPANDSVDVVVSSMFKVKPLPLHGKSTRSKICKLIILIWLGIKSECWLINGSANCFYWVGRDF